MADLGTLGGSASGAYGTNDLGQVVGWSYTASGGYYPHAFLWTAGHGMTDLGTLGGPSSVAWDINHVGQAAGWSITASGEFHAVLWTLDLPPEEMTIEFIADEVTLLVTEGVVNTGHGNSLLQKLAAAAGELDRGNLGAATNVLQAFVNQVSAYITSGVLEPEQGQPLLDAANQLISELGG